MIKEDYIKGKVVDFMGRLGFRQQVKRLEADRASARIANLCSQELDRSLAEFERHITKFIHKTIKDELK